MQFETEKSFWSLPTVIQRWTRTKRIFTAYHFVQVNVFHEFCAFIISFRHLCYAWLLHWWHKRIPLDQRSLFTQTFCLVMVKKKKWLRDVSKRPIVSQVEWMEKIQRDLRTNGLATFQEREIPLRWLIPSFLSFRWNSPSAMLKNVIQRNPFSRFLGL